MMDVPLTALRAGAMLLLPFVMALPAAAATLQVGPGQPYPRLAAAAAAVQAGDTVEIAAGSYHQCAVWNPDNLTIEGAGMAQTVIGGVSCADKSVFVIEGSNVAVRNLSLNGATLPDSVGGNGAGIRLDGGTLTVQSVRFHNDQDGILGGYTGAISVTVTSSQFSHDGHCGQSCDHGIYVGPIASLLVSHSSFVATQQGHSIKSRAARTSVDHCSVTDGPNGTSSYLIDVPNGGVVSITKNRLEKGPQSSNPSFAIPIGEEGVTWSSNAINVSGNTFTNDTGQNVYFVWNATSVSPTLEANVFKGDPVTPLYSTGAHASR